MRYSSSAILLLAAQFATAGAACLAQATAGVVLPPIRPVGQRVGTFRDTIPAQVSIRVLSDGHIFVNDPGNRRLTLVDSSLANPVVVMDTSSSARRRYGDRPAGLVAYRGDTTLFLDPVALGLVYLDAHGNIGRTVALPSDPAVAVSMYGGQSTFDAAGRLVYRDVHGATVSQGMIGARLYMADSATTRDTVAIMRRTFDGATIDTVATFTTQRAVRSLVRTDSGLTLPRVVYSPTVTSDDAAFFSDGTVAVIRASDFHIDWLTPDGTHRASPKIPHVWVRITDSAKAAIVDSTLRYDRDHPRAINGISGRGPFKATVTDTVVDASQIADYVAPFVPGAVTDADGNVWIAESRGRAGGGLYDVVNRKGEMIDRVELPGGTQIVGFSRGAIFLASRDGNFTSLAKFRIR